MIKSDLEILTDKIIKSDITDVVIDLLKNSKHKEDLLGYLYLCRDTNLCTRLRGVNKSDNNKELNKPSSEESHTRLSFQEWASDRGVRMSSGWNGRRIR